uniref:EPS8 signaling adaptor L3b n=1 Tax=Acanthochromis polyacanthus TaxID=80966 RepID=A0A3Q1EBZ9_9TELE
LMMYGNSPFSYSPRGFSQEDFNLNDMSRPSGRNIYMQRKEYLDKLNRQSDGFHVRVEHLFTCELDGRDLRTENDCVAKLKRLDAKGRLWPQDMIMEVQRGYLVLSDIETKTELDSMSLSSITQTKAVLESCAYDSVLTLTVQEHSKRNRQVFLFQCEETGVSHISQEPPSHLENIIGQRASGNFRIPNPRPVEQSPPPSPLNHPPPLWGNREPGIRPAEGLHPLLEVFGQLDGMLKTTSAGDYVHIFFNCLNLVRFPLSMFKALVVLCHLVSALLSLCATFPQIVRPYPEEVPPTVLSPLLTEEAVGLINQVVSPEEDQLWRSQWTGPHVPPYIPEFYDGWQPPAPNYFPPSVASQSRSFSRSNSQRFPPPPQDFPDGPRSEPTQFMRVIYNFSAKNSQELSIIKDEVVQVISKSRRWWLVRNTQGQEGNVPQNVLEPMDGREPMGDLPRDNRGAVTLDMASSPAEVRAWLESKGFSRITVSSLGVLSGRLLLEMTRDQIKAVCPEEGAKVFFQLQGVRASVAVSNQSYDDDDDDDMNTHPAAAMTNISSCSLQLASEPPRMYNGRY